MIDWSLEQQRDESGMRTALIIRGAATLEHAEELKGALIDLLRREDTCLVIDCRETGVFDLAALQLFWSARRSAGDAGKRLHVDGRGRNALEQSLIETGLVSPQGGSADPGGFWQLGSAEESMYIDAKDNGDA